MPFPGTPLQVPDFNKQEVEQISVDAVKKEIASGGIATGTKLYKHTTPSLSMGGPFYQVAIYTTRKEPYTSAKDVYDDEKIVCIRKDGGGAWCNSFGKADIVSYPDYGFYLYIANDSGIQEYKSSAVTSMTDTVVEL